MKIITETGRDIGVLLTNTVQTPRVNTLPSMVYRTMEGLQVLGFNKQDSQEAAIQLNGAPLRMCRQIGLSPQKVKQIPIEGWFTDTVSKAWSGVKKAAPYALIPGYTETVVGKKVAGKAAEKLGLDWKIIDAVFKKALGEKNGKKVSRVIKMLVVDSPQGMMDYIVWLVSLQFELTEILVKGAKKRDAAYIMREIGIMVSKMVLNAPGTPELIQSIGIITGDKTKSDPKDVKKYLNKLAERDPMFGINVILFLVKLMPPPVGITRIAADPMAFGADVMALMRTPVVAMVAESLYLNSAKRDIFNQLYGVIMLALTHVQSFPTSMVALGMPERTANQLWNDLMYAITHLRFKDIVRFSEKTYKEFVKAREKFLKAQATVKGK